MQKMNRNSTTSTLQPPSDLLVHLHGSTAVEIRRFMFELENDHYYQSIQTSHEYSRLADINVRKSSRHTSRLGNSSDL